MAKYNYKKKKYSYKKRSISKKRKSFRKSFRKASKNKSFKKAYKKLKKSSYSKFTKLKVNFDATLVSDKDGTAWGIHLGPSLTSDGKVYSIRNQLDIDDIFRSYRHMNHYKQQYQKIKMHGLSFKYYGNKSKDYDFGIVFRQSDRYPHDICTSLDKVKEFEFRSKSTVKSDIKYFPKEMDLPGLQSARDQFPGMFSLQVDPNSMSGLMKLASQPIDMVKQAAVLDIGQVKLTLHCKMYKKVTSDMGSCTIKPKEPTLTSSKGFIAPEVTRYNQELEANLISKYSNPAGDMSSLQEAHMRFGSDPELVGMLISTRNKSYWELYVEQMQILKTIPWETILVILAGLYTGQGKASVILAARDLLMNPKLLGKNITVENILGIWGFWKDIFSALQKSNAVEFVKKASEGEGNFKKMAEEFIKDSAYSADKDKIKGMDKGWLSSLMDTVGLGKTEGKG